MADGGSMHFAEYAGLAAAACWATGSFIYSRLDAPAAALNLAKNFIAGGLLLLSLPLFGAGIEVWREAPWRDLMWLIASGVIGILVGDSAYFRSIQILGPRKALVFTTLTPPVSATLGWLWLAESLGQIHLLAMGLTLAGICLVVRDRTLASDRSGFHQGRLSDGIWLGVLAAMCQATGIAISKVVMQSSLPALEVSVVRICVAALGGLLLASWAGILPGWLVQLRKRGVLPAIFFASALGTYIGIWLSHISADAVELGVATTQMATTPIFMMLLVAIILRKKISIGAFIGMLVAVLGVALLMKPQWFAQWFGG